MDEVGLMLPNTPGEPPNGEYSTRDLRDGKQMHAWYPNGYGASVVQHGFSYGGREGLYELAVLHGKSVDESMLCYSTPITNDVIGWMSEEDVIRTLHSIVRLPEAPLCSHERPDYEGDFEKHEEVALDSLIGLLGE